MLYFVDKQFDSFDDVYDCYHFMEMVMPIHLTKRY